MKLALFDFDGTITTTDSLIPFMYYTHGPWRTILGFLILSPALILYGLKILPRTTTKEIFLTYFYRGWDEKNFKETACRYAKEKLPALAKKSALARIDFHKKEGHKIVVVSASIEDYLKEWCRNNQLELICTKIEFKNDKVTGRLLDKNCYGEEKIRYIKEKYNLKDFDYVYAYGDSKGDLALKSIANEFHFKSFK